MRNKLENELAGALAQLRDGSTDLAFCGPSVAHLVQRSFAALSDPSPASLSIASSLAATLLRLADEKLNSYPYKDVPVCWRRLYTDAVLLGALARLHEVEKEVEQRRRDSRRTVRDLDLAIVVAGAPGEGREELVLRLISMIQDELGLLASSENDVDGRPSKRRRQSPTTRRSAAPLPPPYIQRPLAELPSLPSFLHPETTHAHCSPFIVRQAASDWPAVEKWASLDYLRKVAGEGRVVPVEVGDDYTKEGWGQQMMEFEAFLRSLQELEGELRTGRELRSFPTPASTESESWNTPEGLYLPKSDDAAPSAPAILYLAQHSLCRQFPALLRDIPIPDLVYSSPETDGTGKPYEPPTTEDGYILNAWFGPGGTKSAAHTDPWWNCYVQVVGSKWIWVAPPSCSPYIAAFGSTSSPILLPEAGADSKDNGTGSAEAEQYMTNTSSLDVTVPPPRPPSPAADTDAKPSSLYPPAFLEHVEPHARQAVLEAGDVLVMPPGWWHAMYGLERSFSVSMWF